MFILGFFRFEFQRFALNFTQIKDLEKYQT